MSTKINVRSPFHYKVSGVDVDLVELTMYVYSGTKDTDKGDPKHVIRKPVVTGNDYVVFELAELIRDYLEPNYKTPLADNVDYVKWVQLGTREYSLKPKANDLTIVVEKNVAKVIGLNGTDDRNKALTYAITDNPSNGTVSSITNTKFTTYTPNNNYVGSDSFKYTVNNGDYTSEKGTVNILVKQAGTQWDSQADVYYSSSSLANARQNVIDQTNKAIDLAQWDDAHNYVHLGFSATTPYNYTQIGLLDIDRQHYQNLGRTIPVPDGYYGIKYWVDSPQGELTTEQQAMIATWEIQNGQVVKVFIYDN